MKSNLRKAPRDYWGDLRSKARRYRGSRIEVSSILWEAQNASANEEEFEFALKKALCRAGYCVDDRFLGGFSVNYEYDDGDDYIMNDRVCDLIGKSWKELRVA